MFVDVSWKPEKVSGLSFISSEMTPVQLPILCYQPLLPPLSKIPVVPFHAPTCFLNPVWMECVYLQLDLGPCRVRVCFHKTNP